MPDTTDDHELRQQRYERVLAELENNPESDFSRALLEEARALRAAPEDAPQDDPPGDTVKAADPAAVPDDLPPITADDLDRLWATATQMVGATPLGTDGPLTWAETHWWGLISAEDGVRLVREVRHLRQLLAAVVVALWDEVDRDDIIALLAAATHGIGWAHDTLGETRDG